MNKLILANLATMIKVLPLKMKEEHNLLENLKIYNKR